MNFGNLPYTLSQLFAYSQSIVPSSTSLYNLESGIASDIGNSIYSFISQISSGNIVSESNSGGVATVQTSTWTTTIYGSISFSGSTVNKWVMTDGNGDQLTLTGSLRYYGYPVISQPYSGSQINSITWSIPSPTTPGDRLVGSLNLSANYGGASSFQGQVSSFSSGVFDAASQKTVTATYQTNQNINIPVDGSGISVSDAAVSDLSLAVSDTSGNVTDSLNVSGVNLDLAGTSASNLYQSALTGNDTVSISGGGALNIVPILSSNAASMASVAIHASAETIQNNMGPLSTLASQDKIASIALTDPGIPTFSLTPSQQQADNAVLSKIITPIQIDVLPCLATDTLVATERGEVKVQHLRIGDHVLLAEGGIAPVVWLGWRRVNCRRHSRPLYVWPVRVVAHAFGMGRPACDLLVSPDHAVFVDGVLVPVRYLLNDATVRQEAAATVTYWHVELPEHGVLLANGLPAESYLDTGNRAAFENSGGVVMAQPAFARGIWAGKACAPLVTEGPERDQVYRRLIAQALQLGWRPQDMPGGQVHWTHAAGDASRHAGSPGVNDGRLYG